MKELIILKYIKQTRKSLCFYFLYSGMLLFVAMLYEIPLEVLLYGESVALVIGAILWVVGFVTFRNAHNQRLQMKENIMLYLDQLPDAKTLAEEELQEMLQILAEEYRDFLNKEMQLAEERSEYYTTWVHQIKTPIAAMGLQLKEEDSNAYREMENQLFRIEQYVDMALSYVRLGEEVSDFVFKEQPLDPILRGTIRKYASQFIRKRLRLEYEGTDITVITDAKWLGVLLEQILSNAIKYTKQGGITITVSKDAIVEIRDTGMGIAKEDLPRIFEKGFTGYNGHSGEKSTGIGLYLAKKTAERLDCKLRVESQVGAGTSFRIQLATTKWKTE